MFAITFSLGLLWVIFVAGLGLGAIIFVHELGHFAVAKMCGVKCEKFFIGFDVGGYKLSRQWGETEYGIGILPLGGYVKMLGQDDNPANISEQVAQSRIESGEGKEITGPDGKTYVIDKRSYLAKTVPQRMAIISAGVIMNVIFAFLFAAVAFRMGVPYNPCIVSETMVGAPAWEAGLKTGDEIIEIAGKKDPSFEQLTGSVTLADLEVGVPMVIRRSGSEVTESLTLQPQQTKGLARIGVVSPRSLKVYAEPHAVPGSVADSIAEQLKEDDEVVAVNGEPVTDYRQYIAALLKYRDETVTLTVSRQGDAETPQTFEVDLPPQREPSLGLLMTPGEIQAIETGSPADVAGLEVGDRIVGVGGLSDNVTPVMAQLDSVAYATEEVTLQVVRHGSNKQEPESVVLTPRSVTWLESSKSPEAPASLPALGIAFAVENDVAAVIEEGPAAESKIEPGDRLVRATLLIADKEGAVVEEDLELGESKNWPYLMSIVSGALPKGSMVRLHWLRGEKELATEITPAIVDTIQRYGTERGMMFGPLNKIRQGATLGDQLTLAWQRTGESLAMVYRFLQKIGGQVPLTALGGPVTIAKAAGYSAFEGIPKFLMFLTMISANLAVINFLPIPMLDGGHMVFLAYEGLVGRPANEKVVGVTHLLGFVFLISLMLFVFGLDLGIIPRNLQ